MLSKLDRLLRALNNNTVAVADMAGEKLTPEEVKTLAEALYHNTSLTVLCMGGIVVGCALGDSGAKYIAKALVSNTALKKLDLRTNQLTNASAVILAAALVNNQTLTELDLRFNQFNEEVDAIFKSYFINAKKELKIIFDDHVLAIESVAQQVGSNV